MLYNLTEQQKRLAVWLVSEVRKGSFNEDFVLQGKDALSVNDKNGQLIRCPELMSGAINALAEAALMIAVVGNNNNYRRCTLLGRAYSAVDTSFEEPAMPKRVSAHGHPVPPEIAISLDRFQDRFPDPKRFGFLIMRFTESKPFANIVEAIQNTAAKHGLTVLRADAVQFHDDLLGNIRTYLHGCGFGIAVYERIQTEHPNANVGFEVGYLMAMGKPVLLLKDQTVGVTQTDLIGRLYKQFDPHDPENSIPKQMESWLKDYGIITSHEK